MSAVTLDPSVFDPSRISEETALLNERIEKVMAAAPPMHTRQAQEIRDEREAGKGIWGPIQRLDDQAETRTVPGPAGEIPIRIFRPDTMRGVYLDIHGGGFCLGRPHHQDVALAALSKQAQVAVFSVDYRLAPEHPYPAGPDDCEAAAVWLAREAKAEFGTDRLFIGGASAGANLAAVTLLRMRDKHGYTSFLAANLIYGIYDLSGTPSQLNWGDRQLILTTPMMDWFHDNYVPGLNRRDPAMSPLYADLSGLPPALFTVGTQDPLLDDSLFMHAKWLAAGNRAELAVYPGGAHGFNAFPLPLAAEANEHMRAFVARAAAAD